MWDLDSLSPFLYFRYYIVMKFLKSFVRNLIVLIAIIIVLALINRWYIGGFATIDVQEKNIDGYVIAYTEFVGMYSQVGPSVDKVYEILSWAGINSYTGVGIYYSDPTTIPPESLKSDIGAVVAAEDIKNIPKNQDIQTRNIPARQSIIAEFPLKSNMSYMAGVMKVYPVLKQYMQTKNYTREAPVTELYDTVAKKIYYIVEIVQ